MFFWVGVFGWVFFRPTLAVIDLERERKRMARNLLGKKSPPMEGEEIAETNGGGGNRSG